MPWRRLILAVLCGSALAAVGVMYWTLPVLGVVQEVTATIVPALVPLAGWQVATDLIVWGVVTLPGIVIAALIAATGKKHEPNQCRACGYSLLGNTSGRCPECGEVCQEKGPPRHQSGP